MRTLYHLPLSPYARKVRIALKEKGLDFELVVERVWERRPDFLAMNPAGTVPVLADEDGTVVVDSGVICEYLDEAYEEPALLGATSAERNEIRRLVAGSTRSSRAR
jgi:glutathione S-transferase